MFGWCSDCRCEGGDGGIGFGACDCECHCTAEQREARRRSARDQELSEAGKETVRKLVEKFARKLGDGDTGIAVFPNQLALHDGLAAARDRALEYQGEHDSAEDAARRVGAVERAFFARTLRDARGMPAITFVDPTVTVEVLDGNTLAIRRAKQVMNGMKTVAKFTIGSRTPRQCRYVVGQPHVEVQSVDGLGDTCWVKATRGLPTLQKIMELVICRFAEENEVTIARVAKGVRYYPEHVECHGRYLVVQLGDLTAIATEDADPLTAGTVR